MSQDLAILAEDVVALLEKAGIEILKYFQSYDKQAVQVKPDFTPLTKADLVSHKTLVKGLHKLTPNIPVLSEEAAVVPYAERASWDQYWLIDPLDGTKEFLLGHDTFSINIALIEDHRPILGLVYAPVLQVCYFAYEGNGAFIKHKDKKKKAIKAAKLNENNLRVLVSRNHPGSSIEDYLAKLPPHSTEYVGSALKLCLVAEGKADLYPRLTPTSEWDTAAGQCILEKAGGKLIDVYGVPLHYNRRDSLVNPPFLAYGDSSHQWLQYL